MKTSSLRLRFSFARQTQSGVSLIMVMLILVVVSLLGVGGAQIALMSERGARNDRDQLVAWQAAEAALIDAEFDIIGPVAVVATGRVALLNGKQAIPFVDGCGTAGKSVGLCTLPATGKPAWLTVNFETTTNPATVALGQFTGRAFAAGVVGIQPARVPRYIMELIPDPLSLPSDPTFLYRVTAMGFGPRVDIQAMVQMIYRP